jgi:mono/diheme cytochrome c family protein
MPGAQPRLVTVFALLLCLAPAASGQPVGSGGQDPLAGSRVFGEKGCSRCHAINGAGATVGPDLARIGQPRSFFDLAAAMWNHLPRMADRMRQLKISRPLLEAQEAGNLVAFLYTVNYFDPPGDARAGSRLFTQKRCIVCHQIRGVGGVIGPALDAVAQSASPLGMAAAMWNHGPAMSDAMRARRIERPTFADVELRDLLAYLRSAATAPAEEPLYVLAGRADAGRRLFVEKRCSDCHGASGRGGGIGPDLTGRGAPRSLVQLAAVLWNKAPAMQAAMRARGIPIPTLTPDELADLVAYLDTLHYFSASGDAERGAVVARERNCLRCHRVGAGRPPVDLAGSPELGSPAAILAALWNHSFVEQPATRAQARWVEIPPAQMADLVAYLRSLHPSAPTR